MRCYWFCFCFCFGFDLYYIHQFFCSFSNVYYVIYRRNLSRAVTLLEMIKRREKTKRENVHLGIEIFEKRYQARDFNGYLLAEYTNNAMKNSRFASQLTTKQLVVKLIDMFQQ